MIHWGNKTAGETATYNLWTGEYEIPEKTVSVSVTDNILPILAQGEIFIIIASLGLVLIILGKYQLGTKLVTASFWGYILVLGVMICL